MAHSRPASHLSGCLQGSGQLWILTDHGPTCKLNAECVSAQPFSLKAGLAEEQLSLSSWLCPGYAVDPGLDQPCPLKLHLPIFHGLAQAGFCMSEKPDLFLLLHHHSLLCAGTDAFFSSPLDGLQPGAGQQLESRAAHFCSALVLGQQSWGAEAAVSPAPLSHWDSVWSLLLW